MGEPCPPEYSAFSAHKKRPREGVPGNRSGCAHPTAPNDWTTDMIRSKVPECQAPRPLRDQSKSPIPEKYHLTTQQVYELCGFNYREMIEQSEREDRWWREFAYYSLRRILIRDEEWNDDY